LDLWIDAASLPHFSNCLKGRIETSINAFYGQLTISAKPPQAVLLHRTIRKAESCRYGKADGVIVGNVGHAAALPRNCRRANASRLRIDRQSLGEQGTMMDITHRSVLNTAGKWPPLVFPIETVAPKGRRNDLWRSRRRRGHI
jgi:hypothetical protein